MKKIIFLRHAKSSWKDPTIDDFDRPLNNRGRKNAPFMGKQFLKRNIFIDILLSSNATRAFNTANLFADSMNFKDKIIYLDELYLASSNKILNIIQNINEDYKNVLIVCHNPGITDLSNYLSNHFVENIPTAGVVCFNFDKNWNEISEKSCEFVFFDYPKKYKTL